MKKTYTFSAVAIAFMFAQTVSAQSSATIEEKQNAQTAPNNAPAQTVVVSSTTQAKATQVAPAAARPEYKKMQTALEEVAAYEAKINANRNTPGFDVQAAERKLQQLKDNYGIK
jgi:type IV secretory pathway VirJ component